VTLHETGPLTTETGAPIGSNQNSETAGPGGPVLGWDQHLLERLAHFNRERIPERVVHARGAGAYGTFTVTADVTQVHPGEQDDEVAEAATDHRRRRLPRSRVHLLPRQREGGAVARHPLSPAGTPCPRRVIRRPRVIRQAARRQAVDAAWHR
jgi:hypothetical protein